MLPTRSGRPRGWQAVVLGLSASSLLVRSVVVATVTAMQSIVILDHPTGLVWNSGTGDIREEARTKKYAGARMSYTHNLYNTFIHGDLGRQILPH
jgi:hypothetical protein